MDGTRVKLNRDLGGRMGTALKSGAEFYIQGPIDQNPEYLYTLWDLLKSNVVGQAQRKHFEVVR